MSTSTVERELPETSMWHGAISDEDIALVRRRHVEKVEEWLDEACFVTELIALHEKYGIEQGEAGFAAYRRHLRTEHYEKLYTYGPTPDPLDEGCDCIFCRMHAEEESVESEPELPEAASNQQGAHAPRSPLPKSKSRRLGQVPAEAPADVDEMNDQHDDHPRNKKKRGPVSAYASTENNRKNVPYGGPHKSLMEADDEEIANDESVSRYDSVGGFEIDWWGRQPPPKGMFVPVYPPHPRKPGTEFTPPQKNSVVAKSIPRRVRCPDQSQDDDVRETETASNQHGAHAPCSPLPKSIPRSLGQVPAKSPADVDEMNDQHDDHPRNKKKLGLVPAYASTDNDVRKIGPHCGPYDDAT